MRLSKLNAQLSGQALTDSLLKQLPKTSEDTNKFAQQALEISRNPDH